MCYHHKLCARIFLLSNCVSKYLGCVHVSLVYIQEVAASSSANVGRKSLCFSGLACPASEVVWC